MEKNVEVGMLYNIYGKMLTEKQKVLIDLYYNNDLSLREIAEDQSISPQGVRDAIKSAEAALYEYEDKIGLMKLENEIMSKVNKIADGIKKLSNEQLESEILEIKEILNK